MSDTIRPGYAAIELPPADQPRHVTLRALGVDVSLAVSGAAKDVAVNAVHEAWGEIATVGRSGGERELARVVNDSGELPAFLHHLSSAVTLEAISVRAGELLMLHAAGLAAPDGTGVLACVGPSGTGKTTVAAAAAGILDYVTDETVGISSDGAVVRYPKPLSVISRAGDPIKRQCGPGSLGLALAPERGLALAGVILLSRRNSSAAGQSVPVVEPVELFEAILALVPETSYLGRLKRPLHRVAEAVLRAGGVRRLTYSEAAEAVAYLAALSGHDGTAAGTISLFDLAESDDEVAHWETVSSRHLAHPWPASTESLLRASAPVGDVLVDVETGQALIFADHHTLLVSAPAAVALMAAHNGARESQIRSILVELFGMPPVSDGDPVSELVKALLDKNLMLIH